MIKDMQVCGYRILIEPETIGDKYESTLDLVKSEDTKDHEKRNTQKGLVVQVGPDAYDRDNFKGPWCKVGDTVMYTRGSGREFLEDGGRELAIVNEEDILIVLGGK